MLLVPVYAVAPFVGLLDGIGSLGAVYSVRRLISTYAGSCLRIRRSSDNSEQDFGFSSNLVDASGIASFIGGGSGFIVTWYDQSGNSLDVTNATAANQPLFVASGIGSKPTLRFDGSNDTLAKASVAASSLVNSNEMTALFVHNQTGSDTINVQLFWEVNIGNRWGIFGNFAGSVYFDFGDANASAPGRLTVATPGGWADAGHVVEGYRATGGTQEILLDGTSLVSGSKTSGPSGTATWNIATDGSSYLTGDISEIIVIKNDTGSTNRATIRKNGVGSGAAQGMGPYYGITVA